jgi:hypothetical protein
MCKLLENIISAQPPEVQAAIQELEDRGLSFCSHFGYENAVALLKEMDEAFASGSLYEWLRCRCGIVR